MKTTFAFFAVCVVAVAAGPFDFFVDLKDHAKVGALSLAINGICEKFTGDLHKIVDNINDMGSKLADSAVDGSSTDDLQQQRDALFNEVTSQVKKLDDMHPSHHPTKANDFIHSAVKGIKRGGAKAEAEMTRVTNEFPGHLKLANEGITAAFGQFDPQLAQAKKTPGTSLGAAGQKLRDDIKEVFKKATAAHVGACESRKTLLEKLDSQQDS